MTTIVRIGITGVLAASFLSLMVVGAHAATRGMAEPIQGTQPAGTVQIPLALVVAAALAVFTVTTWAWHRRRQIFA
ncbi:MAG TPA: hypothetical protein VMZ66_14585 [Aeromicrobium sp.]|nr:hypothetical protein [Aeromicrobium sp.]